MPDPRIGDAGDHDPLDWTTPPTEPEEEPMTDDIPPYNDPEEAPKPEAPSDPKYAPAMFCVSCFASGGEVVNYCLNCGAGGGIVELVQWQVDEIRRNASWVGKRYYPAEEDLEAVVERRALLANVTTWWGRTAKPIDLECSSNPEADRDRWWVTQLHHNGRTTATTVSATSHDEAIEAARYSGLPYIPEPKP